MNREWLVPIVLGLVVAAGLWALPQGDHEETEGHGAAPGTSTSATTPRPQHDTVLVFTEPPRTFTGEATVALVSRSINGTLTPFPLHIRDAITWMGGHVGFLAVSNATRDDGWMADAAACDCTSGATDPEMATPDERRLFHDGHNATKVTAYVFDEAGHLLASNANDTARFAKRDDYTRLPSTTWYLGANGTAPNGTSHLPGFAQPLVDRVRPQLDGLPEGGIASRRDNSYAFLYGTLFVTIRVDELVYAP